MTITLPDEMRASLEARAKAAGYESVDEFVEVALLADDGRRVGQRAFRAGDTGIPGAVARPRR